MRTVSPLSDAVVTRILFELGERALVLLEGETDEEVFTLWYSDRLDKVMFHAPGGGDTVEELLERLISSGATRAFAIVDRDLRSDAEVDTPLNDPGARLFIMRRYELENYVLEPSAIAEQHLLNVGRKNALTTEQVAEKLRS